MVNKDFQRFSIWVSRATIDTVAQFIVTPSTVLQRPSLVVFFARAEASPACVPISGRLCMTVLRTTRCSHGFYGHLPRLTSRALWDGDTVRPPLQSCGLYNCYFDQPDARHHRPKYLGAHFKSLLMAFTSIISLWWLRYYFLCPTSQLGLWWVSLQHASIRTVFPLNHSLPRHWLPAAVYKKHSKT